jgi:hypothetical protein
MSEDWFSHRAILSMSVDQIQAATHRITLWGHRARTMQQTPSAVGSVVTLLVGRL